MAVGKKKSTGKSNSSARKSVSDGSSREKQIITVLISLVILVAVIAVLYPMFKEKGVTGKAVEIKTDSVCNNHAIGYVYGLNQAGDINVCTAITGGLGSSGQPTTYGQSVTCTSSDNGFIKNINNQFDALCSVDSSGKPEWDECNTDAQKEGSGSINTVDKGTIVNDNFLCASFQGNNGINYESWYICPPEKRVLGSEGVDGAADVIVGKDKAYTCDGTAWEQCDSSKKGTIVGTTNGQSLCYSSSTVTKWTICDPSSTDPSSTFPSSAGDGVLEYYCQDGKWDDCSSSNNKGLLSKNKYRYCDGQQWLSCDVPGPSSNNQFYCEDNFIWAECKIQNSFSSDYKALCKDGVWQVLPVVEVPPKGYSWEVPPQTQLGVGAGQVVLNTARIGTAFGVNGDQNKKYYCPNAQFCPGGSYKDETGVDYCYSENTITPFITQPSVSLCTIENNQGVWAVCSSTLPAEYKLYKNKYLCVAKKQQSAYWDKCDQDKVSGDNNDYHCDPSTSTWTKCDSKLEGNATANENFVCSVGQWTTMFKMGIDKTNLFEVKVPANGLPKNVDTGKSTLGGINLCDTDTVNIKTKATVCYTDKPKNPPAVTVPVLSLHSLQGSNQPQANVDLVNDLLYIYDEADQKSVSVVKIIHPQSNSVPISESVLANNFKAGRRLAVEVDGHYYLLTQDPVGLLDLTKFKLISLPSLSVTPVTVLASDQFQFEIQAKKVLALKYTGTTITISVGKVTQALAGAVADHNLAGEYEVQFSKEQPVRLQDVNNKVLVPCLSDAPNDPLLMQLCLDDENQQPFISLERDVLVKTQLVGEDVALLYHWDDAAKHKLASVFYLQTVSEASESPTNFGYNEFNSNLAIDGKRVAVEFEGQLYLVKHEGNILSLPKTLLSSFSGTETVYPAASQSEKQVEFVVNTGKIYLTRSFSSPPPPFSMTGKTTTELLTESVDLQNELSTSMSSQVPVNIVGPINYGIIARDTTSKASDVLGFHDSFKVKGSVQNKQLILPYGTPFVQTDVSGNTLFYYYSAAKKDGSLVKSVQIYTLYNLSDPQLHPPKEHTFDDVFIDIFTNQGKQIALAFNSSFYLLGYAGTTPEEKSFFEFKNLTLSSLDGSAKYDPVVSPSQAEFSVPEGKIIVTVDPAVTTISFSKQDLAGLQKAAEEKSAQEAKEAATVQFDPLKDYKFVLNSGQIVKVVNAPNKLANGEYEMCDKDVYVKDITDKVNLCKDGINYKILKENQFVKGNSLLLHYTKSIEKGTVKKSVTFWQPFDLLQDNPFSWLQLTTNFGNNQFPALLWNKELYELSGASPALEDIEIDSLNSTSTCKVKVYPGEQGEQSGKIFCAAGPTQNLLEIQQHVVESDIQFSITPTDEKLVSSKPFNVSDSVKIIPTLEKKDVYKLSVYSLGTLVALSINVVDVAVDPNSVITHVLLPKGAARIILLPNGETINVNVLEVSDSKNKYAPTVAISK